MAEMPMPCFCLCLRCQRMSAFATITHFPFVQTWAKLIHPVFPLWAPIHQPLSHGTGSGRRDHLLFKCPKGWGEVGILIRHIFLCVRAVNLQKDIWVNVAFTDPLSNMGNYMWPWIWTKQWSPISHIWWDVAPFLTIFPANNSWILMDYHGSCEEKKIWHI